jgi:hypothetical protein
MSNKRKFVGRKPLEYRVAWTIKKGDSARSIELTMPSLTEALELARDQYTRAVVEKYECAVSVYTPAGHTFCDWAHWQE